MGEINIHDIGTFMKLLDNASRPIMVSHMKPDGDAIGSCMAMYHFLGQCGKAERHIVLNNREPEYLAFLTEGLNNGEIVSFDEDPIMTEKLIAESDLIICLDFNALHRTDRLEPFLACSKADKILIDHHIGPDPESFDLIFSETEISSAAELVFNILMATPVIGHDINRLPEDAAIALMTGMTTDTNNFANSVFPSTFKMASLLLERGVDRDSILLHLFNQHSENRLRLMGHMMKDLLRITGDGVAYIVLDRETQKRYRMKEGDTEGFVNMPLSIKDVRMSILAKEDGDRIRISIRSKKGTSANMCARAYFNGGGHENAAGGRLYIAAGEVAEYIERHTQLYFSETDERNN